MTPEQAADLVVTFSRELIAGSFTLGLAAGALLVLSVLWLRQRIAEYRRAQQFKIQRRTPFGA